MILAKDVMHTGAVTVHPDDTVAHAMRQLIEYGLSSLPVVDTADRLVGIVGDLDFLPLVGDATLLQDQVDRYMRREVHTLDESDRLADVAELFRVLSKRPLLVTRDDRICGIISRRDLVRYIFETRRRAAEAAATAP